MLSIRDLILPDKGILYKGVVIILDKFSHLGKVLANTILTTQISRSLLSKVSFQNKQGKRYL